MFLLPPYWKSFSAPGFFSYLMDTAVLLKAWIFSSDKLLIYFILIKLDLSLYLSFSLPDFPHLLDITILYIILKPCLKSFWEARWAHQINAGNIQNLSVICSQCWTTTQCCKNEGLTGLMFVACTGESSSYFPPGFSSAPLHDPLFSLVMKWPECVCCSHFLSCLRSS